MFFGKIYIYKYNNNNIFAWLSTSTHSRVDDAIDDDHRVLSGAGVVCSLVQYEFRPVSRASVPRAGQSHSALDKDWPVQVEAPDREFNLFRASGGRGGGDGGWDMGDERWGMGVGDGGGGMRNLSIIR